MKRSGENVGFLRVKMCLVLLTASLLLVSAATAQTANNWEPVQDAMGQPGTGMGEVLRFGKIGRAHV